MTPPPPPPPHAPHAAPSRAVRHVMSASTHYEVLAVSSSPSLSEIRSSYKRMALYLHPDKNSGGRAQRRAERGAGRRRGAGRGWPRAALLTARATHPVVPELRARARRAWPPTRDPNAPRRRGAWSADADPNAPAAFKRLTDANECISNPRARAAYDLSLIQGFEPSDDVRARPVGARPVPGYPRAPHAQACAHSTPRAPPLHPPFPCVRCGGVLRAPRRAGERGRGAAAAAAASGTGRESARRRATPSSAALGLVVLGLAGWRQGQGWRRPPPRQREHEPEPAARARRQRAGHARLAVARADCWRRRSGLLAARRRRRRPRRWRTAPQP